MNATPQNNRDMDSTKLRIRVAELCGFGIGRIDGFWESTDGKLRAYRGSHMSLASRVPDYCIDLNAMHEAEKTLSEKQWPLYFEALAITQGVPVGMMDDITPSEAFNLLHASAEQRAEAFVAVMGASSVPKA